MRYIFLLGCFRRFGAIPGVLIMAITVTSGCATIIHGTTQKIPLSSTPSNAHVTVDGSGSFYTPTTVELTRKMDHILVFTKEDFEDEQVVITHVISGAVMGNILAGGLIGWGVDAVSGAQYRLVPEIVSVSLRPKHENSSSQKPPTAIITPEMRLEKLKELLDKQLITQQEYEAMRKETLRSITQGEK